VQQVRKEAGKRGNKQGRKQASKATEGRTSVLDSMTSVRKAIGGGGDRGRQGGGAYEPSQSMSVSVDT